jgi:hypothetical protein
MIAQAKLSSTVSFLILFLLIQRKNVYESSLRKSASVAVEAI